MPSPRLHWPTIVFAFVLSAAFTAVCWWAAGIGLGLFFGSAAVVATLAGPLSLAGMDRWNRLLAWAAVVDGAGTVLLVATLLSVVTLTQWLWCYLILCVFAFALAGIAAALGRLFRSAAVGAAMSIVIGYAWLAWPIALAPQIDSPASRDIARTIIAAHPWMAMNRVLLDFGDWPHATLAYYHTTLKDMGEAIPKTILPCVIVHLLLGAVFLWLGARRGAIAFVNRLEYRL
jgi:hypothetical protein